MRRKVLSMLLVVSLMIPSIPVMAAEQQNGQAEQVVEAAETVAEEIVEQEVEAPVQVEVETTETEIPSVEVTETFGGTVEGDYTIQKGVILSEDLIVNGDLIVEPNVTVLAQGYRIVVNGSVNLKSSSVLYLQGGTLDVKKDCLVQGNLDVNDGTANIGNDLLLCAQGTNGNYTIGNAQLTIATAAQINVGGDFYINNKNGLKFAAVSYGTISVKGDFNCVESGIGINLDQAKLVLNGSGAQKVCLYNQTYNQNPEYKSHIIYNMQIDNPNVSISGILCETKLTSNMAFSVGEGGLTLKNINLQGHSLTINGNVVAAGDIYADTVGSKLSVNGDYTQTQGVLKVGDGTVEISGNLYLQGIDAQGNATVGTGRITMTATNGRLNIGKNFILQTNAQGEYLYGILTLKGDLTQLSNHVNIVGKLGHRVILAGDGAQKVTFLNANNKFNILEVTKPLYNYTFSPAKCWETLVGTNEWPFVDVPVKPGDWIYEGVKYVYENNIMSGVLKANGSIEFQPGVAMDRSMFAAVIYRMAGNPQVNYEPIFSDVPAGQWYSDAVVWAYKRGIVSGYPDGRFGVNDSITREQMARMLKGYADVQGYGTYERGSLDAFADASRVSDWASDYVKWAVGSGMLSGKVINGQKYLDPLGNATRAECASMLKRFMEKY